MVVDQTRAADPDRQLGVGPACDGQVLVRALRPAPGTGRGQAEKVVESSTVVTDTSPPVAAG